MTRGRLATLGIAAQLAAAPQGAGAAGAVAGLEVELSSPRVVVHEQLLLEVHVTHALFARPHWEPPAFEGFWAERLPTRGGRLAKDASGATIRTTSFRRALFPTREGALPIAASRVWVRDAAGEESSVPVPSTQIRVDELPVEGQPAGFSGVVGALQLRASAAAREVELGKALRVTIQAFGAANLWDARLPDLERALGDRVEVFPARPKLVKSEHDGRLTVRRSFEFDLVPGARGAHAVPAFELAYFDPTQRRYRIARSEPLSFRSVAARPVSRPPWEARGPTREPPGLRSLVLPGLALLMLLLVSGFTVSHWWRRSLRIWDRLPPPRPGVLLAHAEQALGRDEFWKLLGDALKAGVHVHHGFDPRALTTEEIAARVRDPDAVALLRTLDAIRFRGERRAPESVLAGVRDYVSRGRA